MNQSPNRNTGNLQVIGKTHINWPIPWCRGCSPRIGSILCTIDTITSFNSSNLVGERERGGGGDNGEQSSRGVGRVGTMAAVNSRDKNRLEKRSSRRAWCTFGRHFLSSASARCAVAHVRLRWRRRRWLVAVGENFLFSSLAWQLGRRKGVFYAIAHEKTTVEGTSTARENSDTIVSVGAW